MLLFCNTEDAFVGKNSHVIWVKNLVKMFGGLLESVASILAGVWLLDSCSLLGSTYWSRRALMIGLTGSQYITLISIVSFVCLYFYKALINVMYIFTVSLNMFVTPLPHFSYCYWWIFVFLAFGCHKCLTNFIFLSISEVQLWTFLYTSFVHSCTYECILSDLYLGVELTGCIYLFVFNRYCKYLLY